MTEKTTALGTTPVRLGFNPETDPELVSITLVHGDEDEPVRTWHQYRDKLVASTLEGATALSWEFTYGSWSLALTSIGEHGGNAFVEDGVGEQAEYEFSREQLVVALRAIGVLAAGYQEVLEPRLAEHVPMLAAAGIDVFARAPRGAEKVGWVVLQRDGLEANLQLDDEPLGRGYRVSMPVVPSQEYGSAVLLPDSDVAAGPDEAPRLLAAVEHALVPQAYSEITGARHINAGAREHTCPQVGVLRLAGPGV